MQEIKFRAWHVKWKMMLDVLSIDFAGGLVYVQPLNDNSGVEEVDLDDVELLQYTGLKDNDGQKIYKDYVLNVKLFDRFSGKVVVERNVKVYFKNGMFGFDWGGCFSTFDSFDYTVCEIRKIGNIYENPELMEEKQ